MITTSRYASSDTRRLARKMAKENGERFLARGKRTILQLTAFARRMGEEQISILEEQDKNAGPVVIIKVNEIGEWAWL